MTIRFIGPLLCGAALILATQAGPAQAQQRLNDPIPGINILCKGCPAAAKPGGNTGTSKGHPGIAGKSGDGGSKQPGAAIITTRSNIKHPPQ